MADWTENYHRPLRRSIHSFTDRAEGLQKWTLQYLQTKEDIDCSYFAIFSDVYSDAGGNICEKTPAGRQLTCVPVHRIIVLFGTFAYS